MTDEELGFITKPKRGQNQFVYPVTTVVVTMGINNVPFSSITTEFCRATAHSYITKGGVVIAKSGPGMNSPIHDIKALSHQSKQEQKFYSLHGYYLPSRAADLVVRLHSVSTHAHTIQKDLAIGYFKYCLEKMRTAYE